MTTATQRRQETGEAAAEVRSRLYACLSRAFAFPQPEFHRDVVEGRWLPAAAGLVHALPARVAVGPAGAWRAPADYDHFQSEYIRLFEVGARGSAACPLLSGQYGTDRLRSMEELVRFYNFFGLHISPGMMPDQVTVELEFMHFLAFREAEAREDGGDVGSYLRAQRDFVQRQLAGWWPLLTAALKGQRPLPFYRSLVGLAGRFFDAERTYLQRALRGS